MFRAWLFKKPAAVDINSVIDDFSTRTSVPGLTVNQGLLTEGVYLYDTVGGESIKGRISTSNTYSKVTPITVLWTECGFDFRWDATATRWDEVSLCMEDRGLFERQTTEQHEFFRVKEKHTYVCNDQALLVPSAAVKGDSWVAICSDSDASTNRTTTIIGVENVLVGSIPVETIHVQLDQILTGSAVGSARIDYWFRQRDGLIVRYEKEVSAKRDSPLGEVTFSEDVSLKLRSVQPTTATSQG